MCANRSQTSFVVALLYLERVSSSGRLALTRLTVHRAALVAVSTAAKFVEDDVADDGSFCEAGGVSRKDFWQLELAMTTALEWRFSVEIDELRARAEGLLVD